MDLPKVQKMKLTGYIFIAASLITGVLMIFGKVQSTPGMEIMKYWGTTGIALLTVNAGKRIGGAVVANNSGSNK